MNKLIVLLGLTVILFSQTAFAHLSANELQALREQIQILTQRLDKLEKTSHQTTQHVATAYEMPAVHINEIIEDKVDQAVIEQIDERMATVSWAERMRWTGDFRTRYETIKVDDADTRTRNRIRARAHLEADIGDTVKVGLGLTSGGEDPVSSNQTLGGGGSTKDLGLDLAYFDWSGLANTHILGGKMKNFLVQPGKNGLLWDGDWRPEGIGANWNNGTFFAHTMVTWIESDSDKDSEFAWIAQAGMNFKPGDNTRLRIGAAYAHFNPSGSGSFFGGVDDFFGNSFNPDTLSYLYDYHEIEAFAEVTINLADRPLMLFADYVTNTAVNDNDSGYAFGFKYGRAAGKGSWDISYVYEKLEADAVLGLLTDSDFGGGGTDAKGSIFKGTWAFHKNWHAKFAYFLNETGLTSGKPKDFDRLQLDLNFKY